jgi:hypothetical protein
MQSYSTATVTDFPFALELQRTTHEDTNHHYKSQEEYAPVILLL